MLSSSSSSSSATVRVEKATSDLLIGPDWTMNIDICDSINSNHWEAKDVVRAVKKRILHKNPKVQLLALTLLETMVKNCGDYVHFQIVDRSVLQEMIKIVRKKTDMHVRDKILVLLDSWQEAFGGAGGKYPQYYWAYEELRRSGVGFPQRSSDSAPIFTPPPATHPTRRPTQSSFDMPSNSSRRLEEAMAAEVDNLSVSTINSIRNVLDLLADMLQAVNPSDRAAVKDEVIVDLVAQCRANQRRLMQMLTTTGDEELLGQGLELNDSMQIVLAKHDAIASGSPLPTQKTTFNTRPITEEVQISSPNPTAVKEDVVSPNANALVPVTAMSQLEADEEEEEEEEDDFAQLARRHSKTKPDAHITTSSNGMDSSGTAPFPSNELVLRDPPAPVRANKEQDMIDLLSLTLSTTTINPPPLSPHSPAASATNPHYTPAPPPIQDNTYAAPHTYQGNHVPLNNSYVVPWAQSQPQPQPQPRPWAQPQPQPQPWAQPQPQPQPWAQSQHSSYPSGYVPQPQQHVQPRAQAQLEPRPQQAQYPPGYVPQPQQHVQPRAQPQPEPRPQQSQYPSGYIPPPWATTPGYYNNQSSSRPPYMQNTTTSYMGMDGNPRASAGPGNANAAAGTGQRPFVPSYRLFEDLNVLGGSGGGDGRFKTTSGSTGSSGLSGTSNQSMVGGRK